MRGPHRRAPGGVALRLEGAAPLTPHSTHSDPHSEHHLFRDFPGRALGPGRRNISRVPRASDSEGPKPQTPRAGATGLSVEAPLCDRAHVRGARALFVLCFQLFKRTTTPIKTLSSLPQDARRLSTHPQRGDSARTRPAGQTRGAQPIFLEGSSLGSCPAGLGGCGSGQGACHTPGAAFPRQQGLGLRGHGGRTG